MLVRIEYLYRAGLQNSILTSITRLIQWHKGEHNGRNKDDKRKNLYPPQTQIFRNVLYFLFIDSLPPSYRKDTESLNLSPTKQKKPVRILTGFVRTTGLEPTRRKTLDPKSSAATNYATSANDGANIREVYKLYNY